ncbi:Pyridoxamine 5'-phosphate oxidase [Actinopolyspora alba]|uniref:Pyridoxamine 5'-phosphate oxidase n=1 Tax=Actinopolyspora alba TaxID=673379 RepID=A0A1I1ZK90_9ACTN|nr:pyridoxamine 5'-phosphate oxidase family protein [Actinopolyspora alba]SFE32032.1 Pyridoxamine 5'-phosphate oxidase [Actinopolyspora alba]
MAANAPRELARRIADARDRFANDVDTWMATADPQGTPCQIPLSFLWDGAAFVIATPRSSPTARNLLANGSARLALGHTRDVVLVRGTAISLTAEEVETDLGDAFATKTEFDPRKLKTDYQYFRIHPRRVQAWREVNELAGRDLMRHGTWLG